MLRRLLGQLLCALGLHDLQVWLGCDLWEATQPWTSFCECGDGFRCRRAGCTWAMRAVERPKPQTPR
jgi:hypothetical protein